MKRITQIIFSHSLAFCALIVFSQFAVAQRRASRSDDNLEKLAREVTIYRDVYGVAHVFGRTDASTVFGFAYAQAEDNFWLLEDNYISTLGRASEVYGERSLNKDRLTHALEISRLARAEYSRLDLHTRAICDAFAAGLNYYLKRHPEVKPRLLTRMEPWYPLAFIRYNYYKNGFVYDRAIKLPDIQTAEYDPEIKANQGSNGWVISPSKSATGNAMLFINPHLPFFGSGQVYEGHVHSDEGWNFTGYTRFGFPFPYVGHNENGGWVSTDNSADMTDVYIETFDDPQRPLAYRYGKGYRMASERVEEIRVKTPNGLETRRFTMRRTHHGPILGVTSDGRRLAIRMAKFESDGWLREWYLMTKAKSLGELKRAMAPLNMLFGNVMYADRQGNTFYLYNGAVPRRDPRFDWTKPVDGSDPATEWKGYHTINELPQLTNPKTGWMQNCNTTPFKLTSEGNPDPKNFPKYMVQEGDNPRGEMSRKILSQNKKFTFEDWRRAAFDTTVLDAEKNLPAMLAALKKRIEEPGKTGDEETRNLRAAYVELSGWNRQSTVDSVAMTLYFHWRDEMGGKTLDEKAQTALLAKILKDLERDFGTWRVAWGEINRLQRLDESKDESFDDKRSSVAIPGFSGWLGSIFTFYSDDVEGQKKRYGEAGGSYVSVVEFAPKVRGFSVHVFGASANPKSRHFMDQSPMYARGEFKPAWLALEDIKANLESSYRPGEEKNKL